MAFDAAEQFLAVAELGGHLAWAIDLPQGSLRYLSPQVLAWSGYPASAWDGSEPALAPLLHDLTAGLPARMASFAAGNASRQDKTHQVDIVHRDGHTVPVEIVSRILAGADGVPHSLVGIVRDLSQQRALEAERREFASMLNHEFRTPLSTIDGAIQRLQSTGANADAPTRERYRKIAAAVDRMIAMLERHLSPDVVAASGTAARATRLNPRRLLEEAALQVQAAGRDARLSLNDMPDSLHGEPQALRLALKVLSDNALQYGSADAPLEFEGRRHGDQVRLTVRNIGTGVPEAEQDVIFSKNFRGSNSANRPGAGLGLYMARAVVEVHGGTIDLQQRPLEGGLCTTEFSISLPIRGFAGKDVASGMHNSDNSGNKF